MRKIAAAEMFRLIQPMKLGVHYKIKHSGQFLYKMSNEDASRADLVTGSGK